MVRVQSITLVCYLCLLWPVSGAKHATAWLWQCSENNTEWDGLAQFMEQSPVIDSVSFGAYSVLANGTFGDGWNCGKLMRQRIPSFQKAAPSVMHTPLIDSGPGKVPLDNLRMMWNTTERRAAFITDAVANMVKMNLVGYNLDWEVVGQTPQDRDALVSFITDFREALRAKKDAILSSDNAGSLLYGNCTCTNDYLGVTCTNYTMAGVDSVVSMGTYTHETDAFCGAIERATAVSSLLPAYAPGIDLATPDANITSFFDCLASAPAIDRVFLWAFGFNKPASLSLVWAASLEKWAVSSHA